MSLLAKLKKNSTIKESNILTESIYLHEKDMIPTPVPMLNVALSGTLDGGMTSGTTIWAGPSRHMKSLYCLLMAKTYMDKYPDAILMFYDNEFGSPLKYFESLNIDMTRVVHNPFTDIEQLKMDVVTQLTNIERGDKVFFMIDSIGNAASKKEIDDTLEGKSAADFTRSKSLKSFFRMVTPHLILKDVMLHAVAHTYKCIDGNQSILLIDNSQCNIKDVKKGMTVKTKEGYSIVNDVMKYTVASFVEMELDDGSIIKCTPNHRFLVNGHWVEAIELKENMDLEVIKE